MGASNSTVPLTAMKETGTITRRLEQSSSGNRGVGKKTNDP
jgi:hypothetical protein